jgi:hypothetical protein
MWSDGQGVHATWPSPFAPHIRIDGTWQAIDTRREAGRLIHSLIRSFLFRVFRRSFLSCFHAALLVAHSVQRLVAGAFTVEKQSRAGEKNSSRNSRIREASFGQWPSDCRGTQSTDSRRRFARRRSANSAAAERAGLGRLQALLNAEPTQSPRSASPRRRPRSSR